MAPDLKSFFSAQRVRELAAAIARVHPVFPVEEFVHQASAGLAGRELVARAKHIANTLAQTLPPSYPDALDVLLRSLGPTHATDELVGAGMAPFFYLPHVLFVAERGLDHFDRSMQAQYELTQRFTAEFSVRAYLAHDAERTLTFLQRWARDPSPHVRRLVSEGTRLRLPWAARVPWLDAHPERIVQLLELLKDDPSTLVRRSVANNLNDLGKVHPELLTQTCKAWLRSDARRDLVEHALRSAVKRGDPAALQILGYGQAAQVVVNDVRFEPERVAIGGRVTVTVALQSRSAQRQDLLVDLAVHFVKGRGHASPKVFKGKRVELPARGTLELQKHISLAVHSTRTPNPGTHAVDVLINGQSFRAGSFEVLPAAQPSR